MKNFAALVVFFFCLNSFSQELDIQLFASGLNSPVNIKHAGDNRLFVAERSGFIRIINPDGSVETNSFLDIDDRVSNSGGERGLLGLAFHPDYSNNGYFFVNYINNSGNTVISRFTRNNTNANLADESSELMILSYNQPFSNHNGGDMHFGSDGFLYISSGDGGSGGDPQNNAQNLNSLLGKLLRIDVNNSTVANPYEIPGDNPFVDNASASDEIWAYGLRNPWKFSFDRTTNDIWIGDVGQNEKEEINLASTSEAGLNYGWKCYEGNDTFDTNNCPAANTLEFPVADYNHNGNGEFKCSITGGYRYRGSNFPNFSGIYFFADFCSGEIGTLTSNGNSWDMAFNSFSGGWSAFGEDVNGEIYISELSSGNIFRLVDNSVLGTDDENFSLISIYPNPSNRDIFVDFSKSALNIAANISIYNLQGQLMRSIETQSKNIETINISDFSKGIYILTVNIESREILTQKLIVD